MWACIELLPLGPRSGDYKLRAGSWLSMSSSRRSCGRYCIAKEVAWRPYFAEEKRYLQLMLLSPNPGNPHLCMPEQRNHRAVNGTTWGTERA